MAWSAASYAAAIACATDPVPAKTFASAATDPACVACVAAYVARKSAPMTPNTGVSAATLATTSSPSVVAMCAAAPAATFPYARISSGAAENPSKMTPQSSNSDDRFRKTL
ncbi:hypothetical protein P9209_20645 [Prescottella defluvii]|nr:hypothetical protein P9209_20645 [Prescottella defluvii]